jgi:tetratricopeptide (TPR) repeat protein
MGVEASRRGATRLALLTHGIQESGWLLALALVPLYFNLHSFRAFEPDKIALLRSIVLVMAIAWLVHFNETSRHPQLAPERLPVSAAVLTWLKTTPFAFPAILILVVTAVSTLFSVAPGISLWGSYYRQQGAYTTACYVILFLLFTAGVRRWGQVGRICDVVVLASIPASLYALLQYFQLDPLSWGASAVLGRASGTMGNAIFLGDYLVWTIFLTAALIAGSFERQAPNPELSVRRVSRVLRLAYLGFALTLQIMALLATGSRAPFLGFLAGIYFLVFLAFLRLIRRPWLRLIWAIQALLAVCLALWLVSTSGSPANSDSVPRILGLLEQVGSRTGTIQVRLMIWEGATELIRSAPQKLITGYGPDTLQLVFPPHYVPALARYEIRGAAVDRAHNEILDTLIMTGFPGLIAYACLMGSGLYFPLKWLGLLGGSAPLRRFSISLFAGGVGGVFAARLAMGKWMVAAPAFALGALLGLLLYLSWETAGSRAKPGLMGGGRRWLLLGLCAALVAHIVEMQFGFGTSVTRLYFWVYLGLIGVSGRPDPAQNCIETSLPQPPAFIAGGSTSWPLIGAAALTACLCLALMFNFLLLSPGDARTFPPAWPVLFLFAGTLGAGVLTLNGRNNGWKSTAIFSSMALGVLLFFWLFYALLGQLDSDISRYLYFQYTAFALTGLVVAVSLSARSADGMCKSTSPGITVGLVLGLLCALIVVTSNCYPICADTFYKRARALELVGNSTAACASYVSAVSFAPRQDYYYAALGSALATRASSERQRERRESTFQEAEQALRFAREKNPREPGYCRRTANLYLNWSNWSVDPAGRADKLRKSLHFAVLASTLAPRDVETMNLWARCLATAGDRGAALAKLIESRCADDRFSATHFDLGDLYFASGERDEAVHAYREGLILELVLLARGQEPVALEVLEESLAETGRLQVGLGARALSALACLYYLGEKLDAALWASQEAVRLQPGTALAHSVAGLVYSRMGALAEAVQANRQVLSLMPNDVNTHRNLAMILERTGDRERAAEHLLEALKWASNQQEIRQLEQIAERLRPGGF